MPLDDILDNTPEDKSPFSPFVTETRQREIDVDAAQRDTLGNLGSGLEATAVAGFGRRVLDEAEIIKQRYQTGTLQEPTLVEQLGLIAGDAGVPFTPDRFDILTADPDYNSDDHIERLAKDVPHGMLADILAERSLDAALAVRARILSDTDRQRIDSLQMGAGSAAILAGSLIDVDLPLNFFSGGMVGAAKVARLGVRAAKVANLGIAGQARTASILRGTVGGAQAGAIVGLVDQESRETAGTVDTVASILGGALLGGALDGAVNGARQKVYDDYLQRVATDDPTLTTNNAVEDMYNPSAAIDIPDADSFVGGSTVGAAQVQDVPGLPPLDIQDPLKMHGPVEQAISANSHRSNHESGFYDRRTDEADKFWTKIGASPWTSAVGTGFFFRLYNSKSPTANWLSHAVYESSNGIGRGKNNAATIAENVEPVIKTQLLAEPVARQSWGKRHPEFTHLQAGLTVTSEGRRVFNRQVMLERNRRDMGKELSGDLDKDVRLAADAYDNATRVSHRELIGRKDQRSVDGMENVPENPHWTPYLWDGTAVNRIISAGTATFRTLQESLARGYQARGMNAKDSMLIALAGLRRAELKDADIDMSVASMLQGDGQAMVRDVLTGSGVSKREIDGLLKRLVGDVEERGKESFAKRRNELDMSVTIPTTDGTELQLVDLLSQNLQTDWDRYARRVAGSVGLARQGITNRAKREQIISTIHAEQRSFGEKITPANELRAMFTNFNGGATKGWASWSSGELEEPGAAVSIAKRMTNLAWLGKNGLTQVGETGAISAQRSMMEFMQHGIMPVLTKEIRESNKRILDELAPFLGRIGKDEHHLVDHKNLDDMSDTDKADILGTIQRHLSTASAVQNYLNLHNFVRGSQQRLAALVMSATLFRKLDTAMLAGKSLKDSEYSRLWSDFGLDRADLDIMENMIHQGLIEFKTTSGGYKYVDRMNMDDWDPAFRDVFTSAMRRNINQVVQKSMAGEQDAWMHTVVGSVLTHLKTFTLQAAQKQIVRNFRHMDAQAFAAVGMTFATAMVASYIRSGVTLNDREMSLGDHAKRAFTYGNLTGFVPMTYDPMMTILGLDDMRINKFGRHSEIMPPILSWANDVHRLPGALYDAATGQANYDDKRAIRTLPFANSYIIGDMLMNVGQK